MTMNPIESLSPSFWLSILFLLTCTLVLVTRYVREKQSPGAHRAPRGQVANVHQYISHVPSHRQLVAA